MVKLWKQWCRLCAREDPNDTHINIFVKGEEVSSLSESINKFLSIYITCQDDWPRTICIRCHQLVAAIISFAQRASKVQAMYAELYNSWEEIDAEKLKVQYELQESDDVELELKLFATSPGVQLFDSKAPIASNVTEQMTGLGELKYIDEAMFDANNMKALNANGVSVVACDGEYKNQHASVGENESDECETTKQESESDEVPTNNEKNKNRLRPDANTYNCDDCNKKYKLFTKYRHHMQSEHAVTLPPLQDSSKEKVFICEECGRTHKSLSALKAHMVSHSNERIFNCSWCDKSFKSKVSLKRHKDTHNDTKYICPTCGLELNTQRTLQMHMVVHSDQRRHKCDYCGNEYKRAKALKNHLILHTGLKPYTCNFCEKTFASGANCRSHKKKVHPVELAAMEAAGTKIVADNIPKLEYLRAATLKKVEYLNEKPTSKRKSEIEHPVFGETMPTSCGF